MKMLRGNIVGDCPRCGEHSMLDPQALNALSRTTRGEHDVSVYVCSPCGSDEGMLEYFTEGCQPQSEWPIAKRQYEFEFNNKYWHIKESTDKRNG
tara:strand:- start:927 stop:1211 length:285 start_codon:yes stop_codon:yes gene_type:complete